MALGIQPYFQRPPWAALFGHILENQSTPTSGQWFPLIGYFPVSVTIEGTFTGQVNILVSNQQQAPASFDSPQISDTFTQAGFFLINAPWQWIAAAVPVISSGTIRVVSVFGCQPLGGPRVY